MTPRHQRSDDRPSASERRAASHAYLVGLGRGFAGAILFGLPLLMTMEMWSLAFTMRPERLALLVTVNLPLLVGLSHFAGFERTFSWRDDVLDAFAAWAIGNAAAAVTLALFGVLEPGMTLYELVAKVVLQAVPASIGALLSQSQLGREHAEPQEGRPGYGATLFIMAAGALFLGFNVAPTEEMVRIAYQMTGWHTLALIALTLLLIDAFVYVVDFRGGTDPRQASTTRWAAFVRETLGGYGMVLAISLFVLWTFGRLDGASVPVATQSVAVLAFPAGIGAAAARLIL